MAARSAKRVRSRWIFEPRGLLEVENGKLDEDALTEAALVEGVVDVHYDDGTAEDRSVISTEPASARGRARCARRARLARTVDGAWRRSEAERRTATGRGAVREVVALLDALEEHEDVQRVYSNAELDLAQLEALA